MARKMKKFSAGGAQGRYDRRMADIKKDFEKDSKGKSGRALEVLEAKRAQRTADAEDDRAKRMGLDRTATRKAEYEAEQRLSRTRKFGADKPAPAAAATPDMAAQARAVAAADAPAAETAKAKPQSFAAAFKDARSRLGAGKTFTYNGKSFTTNIAGEGRKASTGTGAGTAADTARSKFFQDSLAKTNFKTSARRAEAPIAPSKFDKAAFADLKAKATAGKTVTTTGGTALRGKPGGTPLLRVGRDAANDPARAAKLAELKRAAEAPGATQFAKDRYKSAVSSGMYAKGGKVKKEKTMKYRSGGSTTSRPTPKTPTTPKTGASPSSRPTPKTPKEPITGGANTVPLTPERKEFLKELAKRNAKPGMAKGGKTMAKKPAKAKAKPFAATKFGAAMVKKSADTKGRAMVKKAGGGKCYASGGLVAGHKAADGIAKKGKTKGKMPTMKKGGYC